MNGIVLLCKKIQVAVTVSNVQAELFGCFYIFACGVCYLSSYILCVVREKDPNLRLLDQVSFEWTCVSELFESVCQGFTGTLSWMLRVPWSGMEQTNFHRNDLYAAEICTDEMPFKSILYSSGEPLYFCIEPLHFELPA